MSQSAAAGSRQPRWRSAAFAAVMLGLTGLFLWLGIWQLQRLEEKQALIARVEERMQAAPIGLPPVGEWGAVAWAAFDFRPVSLSGRFEHGQTVLVFTSLADSRGPRSGPGYWVMTPFVLDRGGAVFVNRGFVPQDAGPAFATGGAGPAGQLTLAGMGRLSEEAGAFVPDADIGRHIEWVRNIERLALLVDPALRPFADIYIDLPAGDPGALPQGGETVLEFPNNHLGYALTWFGFALITPILLAFWIARQRRSRDAP